METGKLTITVWYDDFQNTPNFPEKLTNFIQLSSIKIIEFHKSHMRIQEEAAVLKTLYNN